MRDLVWLVAHWDDVVSDMSVFHRVDDVRSIPPAKLFMLADRLGAYRGAVHSAITREAQAAADGPRAAPAPASTPGAPAAVQAVAEVTSLDEVKRLRAAARLKRYPPDKYGEHKVVPLEELMGEVNRGG
jgi:hypothetical protein